MTLAGTVLATGKGMAQDTLPLPVTAKPRRAPAKTSSTWEHTANNYPFYWGTLAMVVLTWVLAGVLTR